MPKRDTTFVRKLLNERPSIDPRPVYEWIDLMYQPDTAYWIGFDFEDWLRSDRSEPAPNLVELVAIYGYMRLRLDDWRLPIELSPSEMVRWREAGYFVTLEDFYGPVGSIAGGFLKLAGVDPQLILSTIQQQLADKLAELDRLASLPIDEAYTPRFKPEQIRSRLVAQGLTGDTLKEALEEELLDEDYYFEVEQFNRPFTLRQQLESFEWGMETMRMLVLSENKPELGLPNQALFNALIRVDLNGLIARLEEIDVKLRRIWQNLAKHDCYDLNADYEPQRFWWRHWKKPGAKPTRTSK